VPSVVGDWRLWRATDERQHPDRASHQQEQQQQNAKPFRACGQLRALLLILTYLSQLFGGRKSKWLLAKLQEL
jgi:hypothetical protein